MATLQHPEAKLNAAMDEPLCVAAKTSNSRGRIQKIKQKKKAVLSSVAKDRVVDVPSSFDCSETQSQNGPRRRSQRLAKKSIISSKSQIPDRSNEMLKILIDLRGSNDYERYEELFTEFAPSLSHIPMSLLGSSKHEGHFGQLEWNTFTCDVCNRDWQKEVMLISCTHCESYDICIPCVEKRMNK